MSEEKPPEYYMVLQDAQAMSQPIELSRYTLHADFAAPTPPQPEPCPYCKMRRVHLHNCLEIMNRMRTPTGDWWRI